MTKELKKPDIIPGLAKTFLDVPFSLVLNRPEQQLQLTNRGNTIANAQNLILTDIGRTLGTHGATEKALLYSAQTGIELAQGQQELSRDALWAQADLREEIGGKMGLLSDQFADASGKLQGIERKILPLDEFIKAKIIDPRIIAVLGKKGALLHEIYGSNLRSLPGWQQAVILYYLGNREDFANAVKWDRGLFGRLDENQISALFNPYEANCSEPERQFLSQMQQIERNPPEFFIKYLEILARYGLLDKDLHYQLAKMPGGDVFRFGIEGLNSGVTDLNRGIRHVSTGIQDGNMQRGIIIKQNVRAEESKIPQAAKGKKRRNGFPRGHFGLRGLRS